MPAAERWPPKVCPGRRQFQRRLNEMQRRAYMSAMTAKSPSSEYSALLGIIAAVLTIFFLGWWFFGRIDAHANDDFIKHATIGGMVDGMRIHRTIHVDDQSPVSVLAAVSKDIDEHEDYCRAAIENMTIGENDAHSVTYEALIRC